MAKAQGKVGGGKVDFTKKLAGMQKLWEGASSAGGGSGSGPNDNVVDGKYEGVTLVDAKIVEVKDGTKLMVEWTYDFPVGEAADREKNPAFGHVKTRDGMETEQNIGHLKRRLRYFGIDPDQVKSAELTQALELIAKGRPSVTCRVWTSTDGQWQNVQLVGNEPDGWESNPFEEAAAEEEQVEDAGPLAALAGMGREALKKFIVENKLEVKVFKNMTDDDIRIAIAAAMPEEEPVAEEEEALPEEEPAAEEETLEEEAAPAIEKGSTVLYTPPKAKAALTCEVVDVDAKGTAKLKNVATGKNLVERVPLDQLELVAAQEDEALPAEEEELGVITKGSKVEAIISGKAYKGTVAVEPKETDTTVKVKFDEGPFKGKIKDVAVEEIEAV